MLKVKITIEDNNKKAEIELSEADALSKLIIIQNVFNLFGIDTDVLAMIKTFNSIGNAYASFFSEVQPIEHEAVEKIDKDKNEIKEQLEKSYKENNKELETTYKEHNDHLPEHILTGIKISNGIKRYQLFYICPACNHRGKHYIYEHSKKTWCHNCKFEMQVFPSTLTVGERDKYGNFFVAGEFKRDM